MKNNININFTNFNTEQQSAIHTELNCSIDYALMPLSTWLELVQTLTAEQRTILANKLNHMHSIKLTK